ncbi:Uncharacterised protein [Peptoniphilus harei]|uniref:Uncharacterized protein n=1 Tax=Peptoniphilus harei TaxID=54005 RepID=A0A2X1X3P5_9FIRM|nr:Uncharacterised protein [Peptoniphilus harei]
MTKIIALGLLALFIISILGLHFVGKMSFYKITTRLFSAMTLGVLVFIVIFVVVKGALSFRPSMLSLNYSTENLSMGPAMYNTFNSCPFNFTGITYWNFYCNIFS